VPASISVACSPAAVAPNGTAQCSATVQGLSNSSVTWSATGGSINAGGLFTAPSSGGVVKILATSAENSSLTGAANVTVGTLEVPASKHIVMVMEENQSYATVVGSSAWPHLNALISQGALPTNYYADIHGSISDYFLLTTGQTLTNNDSSTTIWDVDNLARRMIAKNIPFRVYAEGISKGYLGGDTGLYVIRHDPFAMLSDVAGNAQVANAVIWPFSQFAIDLANHSLPEFSFIVPNIDDDAHTGSAQQADTWLQSNVAGPLANDPNFAPGGDGLLIVAFDEGASDDSTHGGGHVAPTFWGPNVRSGYQQLSTTLYQHESMLATVIQALGLSDPPGSAANAPSMAEFFVQK
jgi:acid phosphatase